MFCNHPLTHASLLNSYMSTGWPRARYSLSRDGQLSFWSGVPSSQRIGLLSQDKPHLATHRRTKNVSTASEGDLCLDNGLNYAYYDYHVDGFVSGAQLTDTFPESCTYRLPSRSHALRKYIFRPAGSASGPDHNATIADSSSCPEHTSLEEFRDLIGLPLGYRLQWYNILVQLASNSIDFKKEETALVISQCIYQTGLADTDVPQLRASHCVVDDSSFADRLVESLTAAFNRVKENWESVQALSVFSSIAGRLLSLTSSASVRDFCLELLRTLRNKSFSWVTLLQDKAQQATSHEDQAQFLSKAVEVALVCGLCADVDDIHLYQLLGSQEGTSILIQCSVLVQEGKRAYSCSSTPLLAVLNLRFRRLLHRKFPILGRQQAGIDDAIKKAWSAFQPGSGWRTLTNSSDHWFTTTTRTSGTTEALSVHYNALSGELFVDGLPLDRPPRLYEDHPRWSTMFGKSAVEVMPATVAGMQFSAKHSYHGHHVEFSIDETHNSRDLIVWASINGSRYETIPARLLRGEVPDFFVDSFVHWLNYATGTVIFRPAQNPWITSHAGISILSKSDRDGMWRLMKEGAVVVGLKSKTSAIIGSILAPLADSQRIHITLQPHQPTVDVNVPVPTPCILVARGALCTALQRVSGNVCRQEPGSWNHDWPLQQAHVESRLIR